MIMRVKKYVLTFMVTIFLAWVHYPKSKTTKIYSWSSYSVEDGSYLYVISNPPKDEVALAKMIFSYLQDYAPLKFTNGEARALFYKESSVTPIDGNRPKASWWEQSFRGEYIVYKEIDDQEIATARFPPNSIDLKVTFLGEYDKDCNGEEYTSRSISFRKDGSISSQCD